MTDPANPLELASVLHGPYWERTGLDIEERDGRVWLLAARNRGYNYDGGFAEIFDLTDPTAPRLVWSHKQLATEMVQTPVWRGNLLVVPGHHHLTFYRCADPEDTIEFIGRVPIYDEWFGWPPERLVAITPTALATIATDDSLQIWPLPAGSLTAVPQTEPAPPAKLIRVAAVPNPFNPVCEFRVSVPAAGALSVEIFDARGRRVRSLATERVEAGQRTVRWDGRDREGRPAPAGVYLARIAVAGRATSIKLTLAK
jgi:hypothetical protein